MRYEDEAPYDAADDLLEDVDEDSGPEEQRGRLRRRSQPAEAEDLLRRVAQLIEGARPIPLSASAKINNKDEVLDLLYEALERLPDDLRDARWLKKEREEFLAKMRSDGEEITDAARAHAERMVQRTEVVKAADHRARRIVDGAEAEARRLRLECEDYCDQKLATFEIVLERTMKVVMAGRAKLQASNLDRHDPFDEPLAEHQRGDLP
ncbi:MAG: hypothetical protein ABI239_04610 [Aquihabitans sp.]